MSIKGNSVGNPVPDPRNGLDMRGNQISNLANPLNESDAANKGYVDSKHFFRTVTLFADGWSADAPYTQTVAVQGVTGDDAPHVGLIPGDDAETEEEAWSCVSRGVTANGSITFTCYEEKPELDLTLQVEVNR